MEKGVWPHGVLRKPCPVLLRRQRISMLFAFSTVTKKMGRLSQSNKQIITKKTQQ